MKIHIPLRVSLANSKFTSDALKNNEIVSMIEKIFPYVDVIELNVSCPNQA